MGIDPGLSATGFGVIEYDGSHSRHIAHGVISTDKKLSAGSRLLVLHKEMKNVVYTYNPDEASVESIFFAKNLKSAIPVAQARGVILMTLAEQRIAAFEYSPLEVKQAVAGRGRAEKAQVQEVIRLLFGLESKPKPTHASDALAVAVCHSHIASFKDSFHVQQS